MPAPPPPRPAKKTTQPPWCEPKPRPHEQPQACFGGFGERTPLPKPRRTPFSTLFAAAGVGRSRGGVARPCGRRPLAAPRLRRQVPRERTTASGRRAAHAPCDDTGGANRNSKAGAATPPSVDVGDVASSSRGRVPIFLLLPFFFGFQISNRFTTSFTNVGVHNDRSFVPSPSLTPSRPRGWPVPIDEVDEKRVRVRRPFPCELLHRFAQDGHDRRLQVRARG